MAFIQDWAPFTNVTAATSRTQTGSETTDGSTLFLDVFVRDSSLDPTVDVTDNGSAGANNWELVESTHSGSANLYVFICRDAEPISSVTAAWFDNGSAPISAPGAIFLSEFSNVGAEIDVTSITLGSGGSPTAISLGDGDLLRAVFGANVSDRTWTIDATGVPAPDERAFFRGSQVEVRRADAYSAAATSGAIGWDLTAGQPGSVGIINVGYAFDDSGPTPLAVTVTGDDEGYVGIASPVSAVASGGSGARTYSWTSSASGSFASPTAASTTYTAGATGAHVLTCTVTDADGSDSDSLTFTAEELPTQNFTAASGWTTVVGGTRIAVLSDETDATYVETGDDPQDEVLTLTLPSIQRPTGDLTVPLRLSAPSGTVTITPRLTVYDTGSTPRTVTATSITVSGDVAAYTAIFPAGSLADTVDWETGLTLTLTAAVL